MTGTKPQIPTVRLHTLGTLAVRDGAGTDLAAVAARSKEVALLVYLAVAGRRGAVRRDTLLSLFWPELDEGRGRGALSQALYRLRRSLGDDAPVSGGRGDVTLGAGCWCDAAAFFDHLEGDEPARAIELYAGEFLPGFHLSGAPDFEEWSQAERDRLRHLAGEAAERLAREAESSGDLREAVRWLFRKVEITPTDETALRGLMEILDRLGDRAGAVRAYEEFARRLARAYELEPAPETRALLQAVRTRDSGGEATGRFDGGSVPLAVSGLRRESARRLDQRLTIAGVLGIAGIAAALWLLSGRFGFFSGSGLLREGSRIVVADGPNGTAPSELGLAVREALVTDLDQSVHVRPVERAQLAGVLARMRRADTAHVTEAIALEIARREGHAAVLSIGVSRVGAGYQLGARILDAASGEVIARERETATAEADVIDAIARLSRRLRRRLGESLRDVRASPPLPEVTTASLEALQLLARAREHARSARWRQAIGLAEQAVELDSAFAAAETALSAWYGNVANPSRAEHHAEAAYRHAGRLPANERLPATAQYHARHGRLDSTIHYRRLALEREPDDEVALVGLGNAYVEMGRLEDALRAFRRAFAAAPDNVVVHNKLMVTARKLGLTRTADSVLALMRARFPGALVTRIGDVAGEIDGGDLEQAEAVARAMAADRGPETRLWGRALGVLLASLGGRLRGAIRDADSVAAEAMPIYGAQAGAALLRLIEYAAVASGAPELALPAVERAERGLAGSRASLGEVRSLAVVASGYALAGRTDRARHLLASIDSLIAANDLRTGAGDEVRAIMALRDERPEDAVAYLARARDANFGALSAGGRLALADAYASLGRYPEAALTYDSLLAAVPDYDPQTFYLGPIWPLAHERLGRIYEVLGDTAFALRHLRTFAELWRDADPELQPRVEAARHAIRRLGSERVVQVR